MNLTKAFGFFSFIFFVATLASLRAQQTPQPPVQQFETTQRALQMQKPQLLNVTTNAQAPELYPGENVDVGPQRILRVKPRKTWIEITADSQYFYTGNAYLTDSDKKSTSLFVNTIQAAFAPEPVQLGPGQFAPVAGIRSQWFNYGLDGEAGTNVDFTKLDFVAETAFLAGRYQIGYWRFLAEGDFTRLISQSGGHEVYREAVPQLSVQRFFPVNDNMIFIAGYQIAYHATHTPSTQFISVAPPSFTDANDRLDNALSLSFAWQIMPKLIIQPFDRVQYTYYPHFSDNTYNGTLVLDPEKSRDDLINDVGASLLYHFNKNCAARFFVDYEIQSSDYHGLGNSVSFHNLNTGAGLTLDFRF